VKFSGADRVPELAHVERSGLGHHAGICCRDAGMRLGLGRGGGDRGRDQGKNPRQGKKNRLTHPDTQHGWLLRRKTTAGVANDSPSLQLPAFAGSKKLEAKG
jgi:hypothetical protein